MMTEVTNREGLKMNVMERVVCCVADKVRKLKLVSYLNGVSPLLLNLAASP